MKIDVGASYERSVHLIEELQNLYTQLQKIKYYELYIGAFIYNYYYQKAISLQTFDLT